MLLDHQPPVTIKEYQIIDFMAGGFPVVFHLKYVYDGAECAMQPVRCFPFAKSCHIYNQCKRYMA